MPLLAVGDVLQVVMGYKFAGQQCLLTHHYQIVNPPADLEYAVVANLVNTFYQDKLLSDGGSFRDLVNEGCVVNFLQVQRVWPVRWRAVYFTKSLQGEVVTQPLPPNVA